MKAWLSETIIETVSCHATSPGSRYLMEGFLLYHNPDVRRRLDGKLICEVGSSRSEEAEEADEALVRGRGERGRVLEDGGVL